jgi:hypothetical protein
VPVLRRDDPRSERHRHVIVPRSTARSGWSCASPGAESALRRHAFVGIVDREGGG